MRTALVLVLFAGGCCERGSGALVKEVREIGDFSAVTVDAPARLRLIDGPPGRLAVETDDNLIGEVTTDVEGDRLRIGTGCAFCIEPTVLSITVASSGIREVAIDGSAHFSIEVPQGGDSLKVRIDGSGSISAGLLAYDEISICIDGSGSIDAEIDAEVLTTEIDGSGDLVLRGRAAEHAIEIDGSGSIKAFGLVTDVTSISIDGSGDCDVTATGALDVNIDGSGDVSYCGAPSVSREIDGSGSVSPAAAQRCESTASMAAISL